VAGIGATKRSLIRQIDGLTATWAGPPGATSVRQIGFLSSRVSALKSFKLGTADPDPPVLTYSNHRPMLMEHIIGSVSTLTADILHTQIQFATLRVDNGRSASWGTGVDSADRGAWTLPTSSDLELMFAAPSRA
jgi:hypothetical protein